MEVHLKRRRWIARIAVVLVVSLSVSCGSRFDKDTERGRKAIIDEANFRLSISDCDGANDAIDPLYGDSSIVNDEIRIIKASAFACKAGFQTLGLLSNFASANDAFGASALTMRDATSLTLQNVLSAVDVLTENGAKAGAGARSSKVNTFMVFLQFAAIGTVLARNGQPSEESGAQGATIQYTAPTVSGDISTLEACVISSSIAIMVDSFNATDLSGDTDTNSALSTIDSACQTAGLSSCSDLSTNREACDGTASTQDVQAAAIVTAVNSAWQ